ncbi:MAG: (Fe-S)-binding protein [Deltaproteobacteria bacterium]|nr:(Fe-S)-binding protein [Deltaproteobacteria bacterium]
MISNSLREEVYKCIKCGLCMNACPVYKQLYFEAASPRGKVQLIKQVIEGNLEPSDHFLDLMFTCLLCENCSVNCPSGLKVDRLMKAMRAELEEKFGLKWQKRMAFQLLRSSRLLSFAMFGGRLLGPVLASNLIKDRKFGTIPYAKIPRINRVPLMGQYPETISPKGHVSGRVLYFVGCATNYFFENVGLSVVSVLNRLGVEVIIPKDQMCCGLPIFLSGARSMAVKNILHNVEILNTHNVDTIIVDCATCGAALKKEYTNILEEMGANTDAARAVATRTQDISQFLSRFDLKKLLGPVRDRVTYHDPCHLARSQAIREDPRNLLKMIPELDFVEMEGADSCCGGGGTFQWEHPGIASSITQKKVDAIMQTGASVVASGCPGCRMQIYGNLDTELIQVVHPVELLAKAMDH